MNKLKETIKTFKDRGLDVFKTQKIFGCDLTKQIADLRGVMDGTSQIPVVQM